ncbi:MAG TPA: hypothetical protein GX743_11960 [Actinomycetales bacterium]|nr:hypothetical protein [Actinomycetales bacterium]
MRTGIRRAAAAALVVICSCSALTACGPAESLKTRDDGQATASPSGAAPPSESASPSAPTPPPGGPTPPADPSPPPGPTTPPGSPGAPGQNADLDPGSGAGSLATIDPATLPSSPQPGFDLEAHWDPDDVPTAPLWQAGPPTLEDGWVLVEDPRAPAHGYVAAKGDVLYWLSGFESAVVGIPLDPGPYYVEPAEFAASPEVARARYELSITPIPVPECEPSGPPTERTVEAWEAHNTAYLQCLVDAWEPIAARLGVHLEDVYEVRHCASDRHSAYASCQPGAAPAPAWWDPALRAVYFEDTMPYSGRDVEYVPMGTLQHEAAHLLQSEFILEDEQLLWEAAFPMDEDEAAHSRRVEMQAECLATGMVARPGMTRLDYWQFTRFGSADETHWGMESGEFWARQALNGYVGDCNTWVAVPRLVAWDPMILP